MILRIKCKLSVSLWACKTLCGVALLLAPCLCLLHPSDPCPCLHPHPQPHSPSCLSSHTPSSFLWQVLYIYSWEFSSFRSSSIKLLHVNQGSVQISPVHQCLPGLPLIKGSKSCPPPLFSILILCLVFLYCFGHNLKLYCSLSFTCAVPYKTVHSTWWNFILFTTVSHCPDQCLIRDRHSEVQGDLSKKEWALLFCHCPHVSFLAGWNLPLHQQDLCPEEHL